MFSPGLPLGLEEEEVKFGLSLATGLSPTGQVKMSD